MMNKKFLMGVVLAVVLFSTGRMISANEIKVVPAPAGEAVTGVYDITVNGKPVDVYSAQSEFFEGDYYFASFDFSGKVTVEIRSSFPLDNVQIQPARFNVQLQRNQKDAKGNKAATLIADKPFRISFEPNGRIKPLLLFGNAMETNVPKPDDPNVVYFAPGVHRPGKIKLTSNQTLYLAAGAVVKGCIEAIGDNIVICGRGLLAGEESPRFKGPGRYMLDCKNCKNLTVRDIILRNPWSWTAVTWNCDGVLIDGMKICGTRMINDDALDLVNTKNAIVRNCFFRTQDDSIAIKGLVKNGLPCEDILIEDCEFWTDVANIFRIGYECDTPGMRRITAKNIDVLYYSKNYRSPSEYWANTIFWLQPSLNMMMEECHFDNIRIHSNGDNIIMLMAKPMRCIYGPHKKPDPGMLKNCSFRNIQVFGEQGNFQGILYLLGDNPKHNVDGLSFEKVEYFGKPIGKDSPAIQIGKEVKNVVFK